MISSPTGGRSIHLAYISFNDNVVNAMSLISGLLDSLSDVEMRFVKIADRECESASSELKRWFKKLAVSTLRTYKK